MYIGAVAGWLLGWYAGSLYVRHFEPVYFSDFASLSEISEWSLKPYDFAGDGRAIGAVVGVVVITVIYSILQRRKATPVNEEGLD